MHPTHDTGSFTTVSGIVGGVVKAISAKSVLMTISFGTLSNVLFYAAASATVGYFVKLGLDSLAAKFKSKANWSKLCLT